MGDDFREEMAERVPWLSPVDYEILDWLSRHDDIDAGFLANPATISVNIDFNNRYVSNRCNTLAEAGFLERVDGPKYRMTELGWKVVNSEIEADEVPENPDD